MSIPQKTVLHSGIATHFQATNRDGGHTTHMARAGWSSTSLGELAGGWNRGRQEVSRVGVEPSVGVIRCYLITRCVIRWSQHTPFVPMCQLRNWRRSDKTHWQLGSEIVFVFNLLEWSHFLSAFMFTWCLKLFPRKRPNLMHIYREVNSTYFWQSTQAHRLCYNWTKRTF